MGFFVSMGTLTGPYHQEGENQDYLGYLEAGDYLLAALADGAGSLENSRGGAELVVTAVLQFAYGKLLEGTPVPEVLPLAMTYARKQLLSQEDYKTMGSTLVAAILGKNGTWATASLGDSFAVIHLKEGGHLLETSGGSGEFANITELVSSRNPTITYGSGEGAVGVSLSSDGLEGLALTLQGGSRVAFEGFWNGLRDRALGGEDFAQEFIEWLSAQGRLSDDTTLLTAVTS